jgi:hypothetical protein
LRSENESRDGADGVDELPEGVEVHLGVVVDRHPEGGLERVHQLLGPGAERGVDLGHAQPGDVHPQVSGHRHQEAVTRRGFGVEDHDRVGALALVAGLGAEGLPVRRAAHEGPGVRPDEQVVGPARRRRRQLQVHPGHRGQLLVDQQVDADDPPRHERERDAEGEGVAAEEAPVRGAAAH